MVGEHYLLGICINQPNVSCSCARVRETTGTAARWRPPPVLLVVVAPLRRCPSMASSSSSDWPQAGVALLLLSTRKGWPRWVYPARQKWWPLALPRPVACDFLQQCFSPSQFLSSPPTAPSDLPLFSSSEYKQVLRNSPLFFLNHPIRNHCKQTSLHPTLCDGSGRIPVG
jgi:hypothetical protein